MFYGKYHTDELCIVRDWTGADWSQWNGTVCKYAVLVVSGFHLCKIKDLKTALDETIEPRDAIVCHLKT